MKQVASTVLVCSLAAACAAPSKQAASPAAPPADARDSAATTSPAATGYGQGQPGAYPQQPAAPPPPPSPQAEASPPGTPTSRSVALQQASNDIDRAQRELDVAGGDCRNACRALGSMDRACGHLCQLTREDASQAAGHDRCDDAKRRLYNARDRVKSTCGSCPDNQPAVDRNAPVPSMR